MTQRLQLAAHFWILLQGCASAGIYCPVKMVCKTSFVWYVRTSGALGWAATLDILLMMYPVPRSTFLHWMMGESFPTLIKYHRYGTLWRAC